MTRNATATRRKPRKHAEKTANRVSPGRYGPPDFDLLWQLKTPYASDDLTLGCRMIPRKNARLEAYIQVNPAALVLAVIVDVDHARAATCWAEAGLPEPSWIARNPANNHAHLAWVLAEPVTRSEAGREAPLRYLARIEKGLVKATSGDPAYAGLLTKNPVAPLRWDVTWGPANPYGLNDLATALAEHLPRQLPRKPEKARGLGRNCVLFDTTRHWAYTAIRDYWTPHTNAAENWEKAVTQQCLTVNSRFITPLPENEIKHTAKSIAKWTWKHFNPEKFKEIQTQRGSKSGTTRRAHVLQTLKDAR